MEKYIFIMKHISTYSTGFNNSIIGFTIYNTQIMGEDVLYTVLMTNDFFDHAKIHVLPINC